jgi:hypothetical protein
MSRNSNTSTTGLAGAGTYLTAKPPGSRTDSLLHNNYGVAMARDPSFVHECVRLDMDHPDATYVGHQESDIWKVNGNVHWPSHNGYVRNRLSDGDREHHNGNYYHKEDDDDDNDYMDQYNQYDFSFI